MPTPTFKRLSVDQFQQLLEQFPFTRRINAVHMHHTWKPARADFKGHESIVAMWRFHTETQGWSDIAQHITIDPQGSIWLGRNWNRAPASAAGHNGNDAFGPFMFEMVGNFDKNCDSFDGPQRDAALRVVAAVQQRFDLATDTLRFHNMMSPKSCPGTALDYAALSAEIDALKERGAALAQRKRAPAKTPFPDEPGLAMAEAIRALMRPVEERAEPGDAELSHGSRDEQEAAAGADGARREGAPAARASDLSTAQIAALRPHIINLTTGRFKVSGEVSTSPADVDAIFEQHLPKALEAAAGQPLRLLFYAHGGLVSESSGLQIAHKHIGWWQRNGVYPIYFIWETGLFQTISELLSKGRRGRGFDPFEYTTDALLELVARAGRGPSIWGGMKASAEHACDLPTPSEPLGGGAHYTARKLEAFCAAHPGVELHAVGHSAGSIFHAHFLPLAHGLGVPTFKSAHFMAPAVRVDTFKERLLGGIEAGGSVESLTMYTMLKEFERKDNCAQVYRKSLLYLIYHALENESQTPILGLEQSIRDAPELVALFGLAGTASERASVLWSPSAGDTGRSATRALSHGDFDDDPPTMNSILRRVVGKADADSIVDYPIARAVSAALRPWSDEVDWPEGLPADMAAPPPIPNLGAPMPQPPAPSAPASQSEMGRRFALCIGIDAYPNPDHRLSGCVNDARRWTATLRQLGFEAKLLEDAQASRAAIEHELQALIGNSRAGDVIVLQYSGHGTTVPDLNGDEDDGIDEALCPVDFASGALYIDDDIAEALARVPDGVNLTIFMDCCHSGTNSRVAVGLSPQGLPTGAKARYVRATPDIVEAHKRFRAGAGRVVPAAPGSGGRNRMRDVKFSACLDHQVAMESAGSGEFTLRALRVLERGVAGLSNDQFLQQVVTAFGPDAAQNPMLDCADGAGARGLLQPYGGVASAAIGRAVPAFAEMSGAGGLESVNLLARAIVSLTSR